MWRCEFEVTGAFSFPIDMLRYDGCFPRSEEDSGRISLSIESRGLEGAEKPIALRMVTSDKSTCAPTIARWHSFGWKVLPGWKAVKA